MEPIQPLRAAWETRNHVGVTHLSDNGLSGDPNVMAISQASVAIRAAITFVFIPPFDRPDPASPAIAKISGEMASIVNQC